MGMQTSSESIFFNECAVSGAEFKDSTLVASHLYNCKSCHEILGAVGQLCGSRLEMVPSCPNISVHECTKQGLQRKWMSRFDVDKLDWPAQS